MVDLLEENDNRDDKIEVKNGQGGAQSFKHLSNYSVTSVEIRLSKKQSSMDDLEFNISASINGGAISNSIFLIEDGFISNDSAGSSFEDYTIVFNSPVVLNNGTTYYLNFETDDGNEWYLGYNGSNEYNNGTYYKSGGDDGKDIYFKIFGTDTNSDNPDLPVSVKVEGDYDVSVRVTDLSGLFDTQIFQVSVSGEIDIILVGDVNIQTTPGAYLPRPDPASAFVDIIDTLNEADLRYCNMEGIYGQSATYADHSIKKWWYYSDASFLASMVAGGFDAVGLANNACWGDAELLNTLGLLDGAGIKHVGAGANEAAARAPVIITVGGTTFGFLQRTARYYQEAHIATATEPGVARIKATASTPDAGDLAKAVADVVALDALVDVIFFSHHVRLSGEAKEAYQTVLAQAVIDAGADFVFAHGPHINQGVEIYNNVVIMHSLSQLALDWQKMCNWTNPDTGVYQDAREDGLLVKVKVENKQITRVAFIPVARDDEGGTNNVYLTPPGTADGDRQISDVISQSPGVTFTTEGDDTVITLP